MADGGGEGVSPSAALKDQGNAQFKSGNYLKAAALYTQAIKLDPDNATLYSNRAAAFLHLVKLSKALADAETTVKLKPEWEKGHFRKGCVLEAMERYEEAVSAFQIALQHNPQNTEVSRKIKRLSQLAREKKRALDVESMRSDVDIGKNLESLKTELAFESPQTHSECFTFLRQYAEDSFAKAACMVAPKSIISYPQVWKGQGSRKWKLDHSDGFFVQFESPALRKIWSPETLDIGIHEVLPRIFKEAAAA
nr:unnamed protein product [Digitaria exilis]